MTLARSWSASIIATIAMSACTVEHESDDSSIEPDTEVSAVSELALAPPADADRCFNTATWVPSTPPTTTCACDPYNPCASTLISELCTPYTPTGVPMTTSYWTGITCPELTFGVQLVTTTTQTYSASCTIGYRCNGSTTPCGGSGTKHIKKRKVTYGPPICPQP